MSTSTDESEQPEEKFDLTPAEQRAGEIFDLVHAVVRHRIRKSFQRLANKMDVRSVIAHASGLIDRGVIYHVMADSIRETLDELERDPRDEETANDDRE